MAFICLRLLGSFLFGMHVYYFTMNTNYFQGSLDLQLEFVESKAYSDHMPQFMSFLRVM